jgi:hypothetical protein
MDNTFLSVGIPPCEKPHGQNNTDRGYPLRVLVAEYLDVCRSINQTYKTAMLGTSEGEWSVRCPSATPHCPARSCPAHLPLDPNLTMWHKGLL